MKSVIKTPHPPSTVKQTNFNMFPDTHRGSRTSVQKKKKAAQKPSRGPTWAHSDLGLLKQTPIKVILLLPSVKCNPPQHDMPAPDQQHRSKLCRKPHLNFIWAAHLLSLTVTEKPKTWFQSTPVTRSIDLEEWLGRIYPNSRKGRRTEAQERFGYGESDLLYWLDEKHSCFISCFSSTFHIILL